MLTLLWHNDHKYGGDNGSEDGNDEDIGEGTVECTLVFREEFGLCLSIPFPYRQDKPLNQSRIPVRSRNQMPVPKAV
jgi:hypothetical protein